jgi:hypothetical protein
MEIFDNGGKACDRYTLITDDAIFGFDENPFHPQGFGQYCGDWEGGTTEHLGKRIQITDLPERARQYVNQILQEENLGHKTKQTNCKCH